MDNNSSSISLKFSLVLFAILAGIAIFVPVVTNPAPVDCNNYPDGTGGYYLKCKDDYISLYTKWHIKKVSK